MLFGITTLVMFLFPLKASFDTETTGFNAYGNDEILQIAIINGKGETLFKSYIKPDLRRTWTKAAERNGITPRMVKDAPHFIDVTPEFL